MDHPEFQPSIQNFQSSIQNLEPQSKISTRIQFLTYNLKFWPATQFLDLFKISV